MAVVRRADIDSFLGLREKILEAFEDACPRLNGRSWKMHVDDRRDMYWRLTPTGDELIYAEDAGDVTSGEMEEQTFVDVVVLGAVWRPEDSDFVVMLANTGLGDPDVVVFLSAQAERHLDAEAEKRMEQQR